MDLFTPRFPWVEEERATERALIPAEELYPYPRWRAWECTECDAVAWEVRPGWHSELFAFEPDPKWDFTPPRERLSTCPDCADDRPLASR